ncbi:MAG: flagellar biosynthesis protein FlhB [Deferribacteres bacterium]|nr:flagellar biosynthesis protein FlhB [Deferribacteres bacterium]
MADEFQEKTEQATPRKREKAREKGQVSRSRDLSSMAVIGGIIMVFYFGGEYIFQKWLDMTGAILSFRYGSDPVHVAAVAVWHGGMLLAPFFIISLVLALGASVAQGGFVIKPFKFELERLDPVKGLKKIFSSNGLVELLKSILKVAIGCWIVYYIIKKDLKVFPTLSAMDIRDIARVSGDMVMNAVLIAFCYFLAVSIVSALLEKWQFEKSLRMTKQEIKEELKESEGDPLIKSRIRSIQREAARKRMMQEVPTATAVITNPQHLAVAIRYEDRKMPAPKVVAKGAGILAARIKEIAAEHGVPIIEDKPLARSLFKLELNSFIPEELYVAVARILAHIYRMKGRI